MKQLGLRLAPYLLFVVHTLLRWTWRIDIHETEEFKKLRAENKMFVPGHWHGEELGIIHMLKPYRVAAIVSQSADGEIMAKVISLFGSRTARGSSTRGGVGALKGILRLAKEGWRPSVAVDGPKGPRHQVKPGIIEIAKVLKAPIVTVSMASSNPFIFKKSWNKSELPRPFSRVQIYWSDPIPVAPGENFIEVHTPLVAESLHRGREYCLNAVKTNS